MAIWRIKDVVYGYQITVQDDGFNQRTFNAPDGADAAQAVIVGHTIAVPKTGWPGRFFAADLEDQSMNWREQDGL